MKGTSMRVFLDAFHIYSFCILMATTLVFAADVNSPVKAPEPLVKKSKVIRDAIGFFYLGKYGELIMPNSKVVNSDAIVRVVRDSDGGLQIYRNKYIAFSYELGATVSKDGTVSVIKYPLYCENKEEYSGPQRWEHFDENKCPIFPPANSVLINPEKCTKERGMPKGTIGIVYVLETGDLYVGSLTAPNHPKAMLWVVKSDDGGLLFMENEEKKDAPVLRVQPDRKLFWAQTKDSSPPNRDCYWQYLEKGAIPCMPDQGAIILYRTCPSELPISWKMSDGSFIVEVRR